MATPKTQILWPGRTPDPDLELFTWSCKVTRTCCSAPHSRFAPPGPPDRPCATGTACAAPLAEACAGRSLSWSRQSPACAAPPAAPATSPVSEISLNMTSQLLPLSSAWLGNSSEDDKQWQLREHVLRAERGCQPAAALCTLHWGVTALWHCSVRVGNAASSAGRKHVVAVGTSAPGRMQPSCPGTSTRRSRRRRPGARLPAAPPSCPRACPTTTWHSGRLELCRG